MENYFKISEDAMILSLVNYVVSYDGDMSDSEKAKMKIMANLLINHIYEGNKTEKYARNQAIIFFLNFVAKIFDNDDIEAKTVQLLLSYRVEDERVKELFQTSIKTDVTNFYNLPQDEMFPFLLNYILVIGMDIEATYQEIDMLEAEVTGKPVFV